MRLPPSPLGEMPALLTSACNSPLSRCLISLMARSVLSASARSTWMWSSGPIAHGQFSGKACREQVITRHPAAAKRLTVAWPMPRLAPVRSSVRRGWFEAGAFGMALTWQSVLQILQALYRGFETPALPTADSGRLDPLGRHARGWPAHPSPLQHCHSGSIATIGATLHATCPG